MRSAPHRVEQVKGAAAARPRCRIDCPRGLVTAGDGRVLVAGVAVVEPGGALRVEVRLDGGRWQPVEVDAEPAGRRLRWRTELAVLPGRHRVHARAVDPGAAETVTWARPMVGWSVREFIVT